LKGSDHTFECQIKGSPKPSVTWFKDATVITSTNDVKIVYEEEICKLIIYKCQLDDSGTYTVVAKNVAGFDTCSAQLTVDGKRY